MQSPATLHESDRVYVRAAGGTGPDAVDLREWVSGRRPPLNADATPAPLRAIVGEVSPRMSRLASRFAQLAVLGASSCLRHVEHAPHPSTRVYLGTGLGDIAATDALYYCVMPPTCEAPPPARFATSGNNMAAFFVAQHAQLTSRNLTVSEADLSFECALDLALSDLLAGAVNTAMVGGVDETTSPREFYTRRYSVERGQPIGEGSGWLLLDCRRESADPGRNLLGCITGRRLLSPQPLLPAALWADQVMDALTDLGFPNVAPGSSAGRASRLTLTAGCGAREAEIAALTARLPAAARESYLPYTGRFPTASALGIAGLFARQQRQSQTCLHVNRDASGRTGLVTLEVYGDAN